MEFIREIFFKYFILEFLEVKLVYCGVIEDNFLYIVFFKRIFGRLNFNKYLECKYFLLLFRCRFRYFYLVKRIFEIEVEIIFIFRNEDIFNKR